MRNLRRRCGCAQSLIFISPCGPPRSFGMRCRLVRDFPQQRLGDASPLHLSTPAGYRTATPRSGYQEIRPYANDGDRKSSPVLSDGVTRAVEQKTGREDLDFSDHRDCRTFLVTACACIHSARSERLPASALLILQRVRAAVNIQPPARDIGRAGSTNRHGRPPVILNRMSPAQTTLMRRAITDCGHLVSICT
jgi:hypothetical protein